MNVQTVHQLIAHRNHATAEVALPAPRGPRERAFGTGYGRSSGYASQRRYVSDWGLTPFRLA